MSTVQPYDVIIYVFEYATKSRPSYARRSGGQ
jgi:hypothetical protein